MRAPLLLAILTFLCTFQLFEKVKANHIAAVNITYEGLDAWSYIVTVRIYRDCSSGQFVQPSIIIKCKSNLGDTLVSQSIPIITGNSTGNNFTGNFIKLPCLGIDSCESPPGYAVEEFEYQDTIILPAIFFDWVVSYETLGNRNANDVIVDATSKPIYVSALINNLDAPGNSSPDFEKEPVAIFCVDRQFFFDQGAIEADGDSLVYSLAQAQGDTGEFLTYNPPYTFGTPFDVSSPPLIMDSINGVISFTPIGPSITSVICVLIEEYDTNGTLIGSVKNDMQVFINDSCVADTLNFLGDTTIPTGNHPAITAFCLDNKLWINFDNPIQCETISSDGSDFILTMPIGGTLAIDSIWSPSCTGVGGLTDSICIYLSDSMRFNGSYYLYDTIGSDGTPILSECGLVLNDTIEIILNNCVKATVNLMNVTVENNNDIRLIWGKYTENFEDSYFIKYEVLRSTDPLGPYTVIDYVSTFEDTFYFDQNVSVSSQEYNYTIRMDLDPSLFLAPESDSIQSILLQSSQAPTNDTNEVDLVWTPYWGWASPTYQVMKKTANGPWKKIHETSDTNFRYKKPLLANNYELKIMTSDNINELSSESNWIHFEIPIRQIPNVITPNGDDINDFFFVNERLLYEQVHLIVYNRWGMKVFEDLNYNNKWDGDNFVARPLPDGTYYYVLKLTEAEKNKAGFITIIR